MAILRGVANVRFFRLGDQREAGFQRLNHALGIVYRQRSLGDVGQMIRCFHLQFGDVRFGFDQINTVRDLPHRAFHFRMPFVADHDDFKAALAHALDLDVYLGHQRTRRIENMQIASLRFGTHRQRYAMRGENHSAAIGCFVQLLDKHRAFVFQIIHNIFIVNDFVAHIDRRAELLQCALDNADGAINTGAKSARLCQYNRCVLHHG